MVIASHIVASKADPVVRVMESKLIGHVIPLRIECISVLTTHILEDVIAFLMAASATNSLLDHFPTLAIHSALMGDLLMLVTCVFIHLIPLTDSISVTKSTFSLSLVCLFNRIAVAILLDRGHRLHLLEHSAAHTATIYLHWLSHGALHVATHLGYHLVHIAKTRPIEEWIVCKRIPAEAFHHIIH